MLKKIVNGKEVICSAEEEATILVEWQANADKRAHYLTYEKYAEDRAAEYPPVGDQLDAILKHMNYMQMTMGRTDLTFEDKVSRCCNMVTDLDSIISQWLAVKAKYPKPEGTE